LSGETDLSLLMGSLEAELQDGRFVFATLKPGDRYPADVSPVLTFREAEGLTLILSREDAERSGLASEFPCRWITLKVYSSLNAVGFLASITNCLAKAGISVNAVSAFHHDHLFVPDNRADEAMSVLLGMKRERCLAWD
jgi:hypothetical protein